MRPEVQVLLDPPLPRKWSSGRTYLQAVSDCLNVCSSDAHIDIVKRDTINNTVGAPREGRASVRCRSSSEVTRACDHAPFLGHPRVCLAETTVLSKSSTLTRMIARSCNKFPATDMAGSGIVCFLVQNKGAVSYQLPHRGRYTVFFWIKSSARRAFGGCLGSKRR